MAYQATFLGQLDKYFRGLSISEGANERGLSWNSSHQWEKRFFGGVDVTCSTGVRRLPFVIRCKEIEQMASHTSKLFETLHCAQTSTVPADEYLLFNLFVKEALEQSQRLFSSAEPTSDKDLDAAQSGLLVKLMETLGLLLGLAFSFGEESLISLPALYENIIAGALWSTDGETALSSAMVSCK